MLTGKQKSYLRSQAHGLQPVVQIGKHIVTESVVDTTLKALEARELIKISVLQNCLAEPKEVADVLAQQTEAQLVQVIGRVIVLYKQASKPANRHLSNKMPT